MILQGNPHSALIKQYHTMKRPYIAKLLLSVSMLGVAVFGISFPWCTTLGRPGRLSYSEQQVQESIDTFVKLRTGDGSCVWTYTGCIRNPLTGTAVVGVLGVEAIRLLSNSSYLSSKLFVYTDPTNSSSPVTSFRVRPQAPRRVVHPVRTVYEMVSLELQPATDSDRESAPKDHQNRRPKVLSRIVYPGGRTLSSRKVDLAPADAEAHFSQDEWGMGQGLGLGLGRALGSSRAAPSRRARKSSVEASTIQSTAGDGDSSSAATTKGPSSNRNRGGFGFGRSNQDRTRTGVRMTHYINGVSARTHNAQGQALRNVSRWVSFNGAGAGDSQHGKNQEYYLIKGVKRSSWGLDLGLSLGLGLGLGKVGGKGAAQLHCSRYGECPPWFSLGRGCNTELVATRHSSRILLGSAQGAGRGGAGAAIVRRLESWGARAVAGDQMDEQEQEQAQALAVTLSSSLSPSERQEIDKYFTVARGMLVAGQGQRDTARGEVLALDAWGHGGDVLDQDRYRPWWARVSGAVRGKGSEKKDRGV